MYKVAVLVSIISHCFDNSFIDERDDNWQTGWYKERDQSSIYYQFIVMQYVQTIFWKSVENESKFM